MVTRLEKIDCNHIDAEIIMEACNILKDGGLVAFPTETVYGLGADALNEVAAMKIYEAKGRPSDNPLIVHISRYSDLKRITDGIPEIAEALARKFWPGPLTMILKKSWEVPEGTTGGLATVAVRMPSHPVALAVISASGGFVAAPSANRSGRPSPTSAEHVMEDLKDRIELILDGGSVSIGLESTIVDLSTENPVILRPGYITAEQIEKVIGQKLLGEKIECGEDCVPKAPGMKYRHYAPKAEMMIVEGTEELVIKKIRELTKEQTEQGKLVGIIAADETGQEYDRGIIKNIGSREDEDLMARRLYSILREFDQMNVDYIYSEAFQGDKLGNAIMNRLAKAAGHRILKV